jgi:hypothetical protein
MLGLLFSPLGRALGMAVAVMLALGGVYVKGRTDCAALANAKALATENAWLRERIAIAEHINESDRRRAEIDAKQIEDLNAKLATPKNDAACLDESAADRVRSIR